MRILIQKFGGTSVKDKQNRKKVIQKINDANKKNYKLVIVISAMGRKPSPYATDSLLSLVDYPKTNSSARELDLLMSCGETIAAIILSHELKESNFKAIALTGSQAGFITDNRFNQATIKEINVNRILKELKANDIIVIAGCQGMSIDGEITTIGRGGSDTTATALGVSLDAERIDIFTDVNGMMTADPTIVESVKLIEKVTYEEVRNLAYQGAQIIHPSAVEIAMQAKIPLRIRSTYTNSKGTLVVPSNKQEDLNDKKGLITGIAHQPSLSQITIQIEDSSITQSIVFKSMADANISVDFIHISPTHITYTVPDDYTERASDILKSIGLQPEIIKQCAKISVVGIGMAGVPGVVSKIVMALTEIGIQILQSADSHTTIWVLIDEKYLKPAVNALHEKFELDK